MALEQDPESAQYAPAPDMLDALTDAAAIRPHDARYQHIRAALRAFLREVLVAMPEAEISAMLVDFLIAEIDRKMSEQVNAIIHNEEFQMVESSWRALKFLIDRTDFRQNITIEIISLSKEDLLQDFEDAPEVMTSGLYKHLYTAEYGQYGGQPVGAVIANYDFGPSPQDVKLLQKVASVSAMAHAPFIAAASKDFFGIESWDALSRLKDLRSVMEMPQYSRWNQFRQSEDARYVGLTLPKFLLRLPYCEDSVSVDTFMFQEQVEEMDDFCWGNTAFAFATRLTDSFAKYRWCTNIIGPQGGGTVENLPRYQFRASGDMHAKIPTQVLLSERWEYELAEEGFISLSMRKGSDNAAFFSANSVQAAKTFPNTAEGKEAETNYRLSTQLPYMMLVNRLAHYIKVIQRENIGAWKERQDLENELNKWLGQYVTGMDNPDPVTRSKRPLRMAHIEVHEVEGIPGWYSVRLKARPHFKYMGANFTLSLVGKLDRE
jgi:type VI secretion protein, EvpB/VC_A0108 family